MPRKLRPPEPWWAEAADLMARYDLSLREAAAELGGDSKLTKEAVVGQLYRLAERLAADREDYKAANALLKLAKLKGWLGEGEPSQLWGPPMRFF